jgi:hypothetical protein
MIRAENDGGQCRKLWDRMSPARDAWDDWDLMFAFHDEKKHRFHFLVHEDAAGEPDGVVPLVYDTTEKRFMLMAGSYPDGRVLWLRCEFWRTGDAVLPRTIGVRVRFQQPPRTVLIREEAKISVRPAQDS